MVADPCIYAIGFTYPFSVKKKKTQLSVNKHSQSANGVAVELSTFSAVKTEDF